ncbi:MAG: DUF1640 domain-containing protein [Gammaproteobacteria bacterium]|nr:DUF1640 domain-containing protein [Rhodocyclaceae bacterium]MBU3908732.1 DUF1640 domain-containing protein [Gammaproteobacteria bacterium]MBU3988854.1 DUF1640 domain-containing protein [Gammaproteobacteria bacterium]MBU4004760.1 DUF1640 domain-containing protein [Gammaproteobacteria bacterium]MBU4021363.1 DUF1640 domain-containing protein [Gammaproteobacteria bacterium]
MASITFDTLKFADTLKAAGVPAAQAEAEARALAEAFASNAEALATKGDIVRLESRLDTLEMRLTIKLGAFIAVAVGILIAVMRLPA